MSLKMQELAWNTRPDGLLTLIRLSVNHSTTVNRVETETTSTHTRTASPCVLGEVCMRTRILRLIMPFRRFGDLHYSCLLMLQHQYLADLWRVILNAHLDLNKVKTVVQLVSVKSRVR